MNEPIGPCACCGIETPHLHNQRDDDGQYYCERCCHVAEAEEVYNCYLVGLTTYDEYLCMVAYTDMKPRPEKKVTVG